MSAPQPGTSLPWAVGDEDEGSDGVQYIDVHAGEYGSTYECVAYIQASFNGNIHVPLDDRARKDARYIVTACNAFPSMADYIRAKAEAGDPEALAIWESLNA